jgi:catechol 2,3-dioxygenase-like lactoylglutathione lyase family enzyme
MAPYVDATEQLVVEVFVRDIAVSRAFYRQLGFEVNEDRATFVVLTWEGHQLFLDERRDLPPHPAKIVPQANIRIMVADVDEYWARAQASGARVFATVGDRDYGLRDFTILDPDGVGLRFASRLERRLA